MDYLKAIIKHLDTDCVVTLKDGKTDESVVSNWTAYDPDGNTLEIDYDAVETLAAEEVSNYTATQYQRDRAKAYPRIGDQLDALFHAGVFPDDMAAQIQAVKDKYPKE